MEHFSLWTAFDGKYKANTKRGQDDVAGPKARRVMSFAMVVHCASHEFPRLGIFVIANTALALDRDSAPRRKRLMRSYDSCL